MTEDNSRVTLAEAGASDSRRGFVVKTLRLLVAVLLGWTGLDMLLRPASSEVGNARNPCYDCSSRSDNCSPASRSCPLAGKRRETATGGDRK